MGNRPNILCIMTDQQLAYLMSCTGDASLSTPALDSIVAAESRRVAGMSQSDGVLHHLPANHRIASIEPEAIGSVYLTHTFMGVQYRGHARDNWREREWRIYRDVYRRLTETVDEEIGNN